MTTVEPGQRWQWMGTKHSPADHEPVTVARVTMTDDGLRANFAEGGGAYVGGMVARGSGWQLVAPAPALCPHCLTRCGRVEGEACKVQARRETLSLAELLEGMPPGYATIVRAQFLDTASGPWLDALANDMAPRGLDETDDALRARLRAAAPAAFREPAMPEYGTDISAWAKPATLGQIRIIRDAIAAWRASSPGSVTAQPYPSRVLLSGEEIALTEPLDLPPGWREVTLRGQVKADAWRRIEAVVRGAPGRKPPTLTLTVPGAGMAAVVLRGFEANVHRHDTTRGFFDVRIDLVRVAPPPRVALPTPAGLAALRAFGDALAAVAPHAARRVIDDAIREDARLHPAFARARMAAVMAAYEHGSLGEQAAVNLTRELLSWLHDYEQKRGGTTRPSSDALWYARTTFGMMVCDHYERARGLT